MLRRQRKEIVSLREKERQRLFCDCRSSAFTESQKKIQREVQEEIVSSQGELFSFHYPISHLLSPGIRRACEVEERHVWLSQAPGGTLLVRIRSASIRLYRIPRTEVFIISFSLHAFICQIYILCLHLSLIRLKLNVLHAFHLEILCSRKSLFFLQVVSEPGLGLGLHVLKHCRSNIIMHKLIRCRSKVDLGMISLDLE